MAAIRNPIEWSWDQLRLAALAAGSAGRSLRRVGETLHSPAPAVRRIAATDLRDVLAKGLADFGAYRTDVVFLCVIYPIIGLVLRRLAATGCFRCCSRLPPASGSSARSRRSASMK